MANDKRDILRKAAIAKFEADEGLKPNGDDVIARADRMSMIAYGRGFDAGHAAATAEGIPQADEITQLKADLARYEEFCRRQGYMYFNYKHTGRRMFWTEAGWELEPHSYDAESYIFENALEAFSAITAQGEPKNQTIATLDAIGKE